MSYIILVTIILHQIFLFFVKKRFDIFNIYLLIDLVLVSMFYLGCNSDDELRELINYNIYFFLAVYIGILGLYMGLHVVPFYRRNKTFAIKRYPDITFLNTLIPIALFCLAFMMIIFNGMRSSGLGLMDYLTKGRMAEYLASVGEKDQGGAFWFQIVAGFRPILLYLLCYFLEKKRWVIGWGIYLILLIGILCIFNTRLEVIITLAIPVAYWHYRVKPIKLWLIILAIPLFVFSLAILDTWRNEGVENLDKIDIGSERRGQGFSRDINAIRGFEILWQKDQSGTLDKEYGANYLYMLLTPIPRFLWSDKPILAFEPRWTSKVIKDFRSGVWIFTAWGEGIAQFGVMGIFTNLFLYGFVIKIFLLNFNETRPYLPLVWFYYAVLASTFLRGGFQALFIMTVFYFIPLYLFILIIEKRLKLR